MGNREIIKKLEEFAKQVFARFDEIEKQHSELEQRIIDLRRDIEYLKKG